MTLFCILERIFRFLFFAKLIFQFLYINSLTESFVPLGGFFPTPEGVSTNCVSRCHLCNEKCEQEVTALSDGGYTASVAYQFPSSLPSWLERPELNTTRASDNKVCYINLCLTCDLVCFCLSSLIGALEKELCRLLIP